MSLLLARRIDACIQWVERRLGPLLKDNVCMGSDVRVRTCVCVCVGSEVMLQCSNDASSLYELKHLWTFPHLRTLGLQNSVES